MKNFFILFIICTSNFGKEVTAKNVNECTEFNKMDFSQVKGTSGNFDEVIARGKQFVSLQNNELTIFEDLEPIIRKYLSHSPRRLNLDLFNNILFDHEDYLGIYTFIPENDDLMLKIIYATSGITTRKGVAFDNNNTVYALSASVPESHIPYSKLFYSKISNQEFKYLSQLEDFNNVTHIIDGDGNTFYFVHDSKKTSWIVNAATEQTIMQTSSIKHLSYISEDYDLETGFIFVLDYNCTMKAFHITEKFTLQKHFKQNYLKIMQFEDCDYGLGVKLVFRAEEVGRISFFFNKNNLYRVSMGNNPLSNSDTLRFCLLGKLNNVSINSGAVNSNYIMLATSNGLWVSKW